MKTTDKAIEFVLTRQLESLAKLTEKQVASAIGISNGELSRLFEQEQKISLEKFILKEKLLRAALILEKDQHISIDQLARQLGFLSTGEFEMAYKSFLAVTPARYRQLLRMANKS